MSQVTNGKLMAVEVKSGGSTFERGTPKDLFDSGYFNLAHVGGAGPYHAYAVSADGQSFLIPRPPSADAENPGSAPIAVVVNWETGLKK